MTKTLLFPNFKNKHDRESMISPKDFIDYEKKQGNIKKFKHPDSIIFCYSRKLMDYIIKNEAHKKVKFEHANLYLLKKTSGRIAVVGDFGIGAPIVITLLEELIAFGVKNLLPLAQSEPCRKILE